MSFIIGEFRTHVFGSTHARPCISLGCWKCFAWECPDGKALRVCAGCTMALYCSRECQVGPESMTRQQDVRLQKVAVLSFSPLFILCRCRRRTGRSGTSLTARPSRSTRGESRDSLWAIIRSSTIILLFSRPTFFNNNIKLNCVSHQVYLLLSLFGCFSRSAIKVNKAYLYNFNLNVVLLLLIETVEHHDNVIINIVHSQVHAGS